ncbi:MAG TPA: response regulator transcription factor [Dehalococcoidia bacterium]|jgi:DNA-binding NarL/FixJ family response regulator|nr:response regulator transcription factor [Dehalococcoidia bacterium]
MNKTQVIIVSQQLLFRQGIEHALSKIKDIAVSATAELSEDVLSIIDNLPPDVALVDIDAPADSGLKLARKIKQRLPTIGVVVLTSTPDDAQLFQALKAQAVAYLSKEITPEELVDTIRRVARGEHPINESLTSRPRLAEQVLQQFQELSWRSEAEGFIAPLTPREMEILNYIAQGYLNKQIAAELDISEQTIKNHVTSILRKLNANARTEAVVVAIKQGLISLG